MRGFMVESGLIRAEKGDNGSRGAWIRSSRWRSNELHAPVPPPYLPHGGWGGFRGKMVVAWERSGLALGGRLRYLSGLRSDRLADSSERGCLAVSIGQSRLFHRHGDGYWARGIFNFAVYP
jgi:hypothetical protein